jgi:hypothetical protein
LWQNRSTTSRWGSALRKIDAPYLCLTSAASRAAWSFDVVNNHARGGAWARSTVLVVCTRALSLISVHDPGLPWVGDMMVGGVIPLGEALRPLGL